MPEILLLAVLAATLSTVGCLESEDETLTSSTEDSLLGTWRLDLAEVDTEEFEFTYAFRGNNSFANRIGGTFLQQLKDLNEIDGIDIDTGRLEVIDDGFVEYNGTWSAQGDNLELHFETMKIEVGGEVPIAKQRIAVPVHEEDLTSAGENQVVYSYRFAKGQLLLNGESLTLGIDLAETAPAAGLDPLAVETLRLIGEFVRDQISAGDEDEFAMSRVE